MKTALRIVVTALLGLSLCSGLSAQLLTEGRVFPLVGFSWTTYTFSVKWFGSTPSDSPGVISVDVTDGVRTETFTLQRITSGTPNYLYGVEYAVTTRLDQYFDLIAARDGLTYRFYTLLGVEFIPDGPGPFINDRPVLSSGAFSPVDTISATTTISDIRRTDAVTVGVRYRDVNNEAPADGYPLAWIGNKGGWQFNGGILSSVEDKVTLISATVGSGQTWAPSQFRGQPMTWSSGARTGITDTILDNTESLLIVRGQLNNSGPVPVVGDRFAIAEASGTVASLDFEAAAAIDNTKTFVPDALKAAPARLQIVAGSAVGKAYAIAGNTDQTIALSRRLLPLPVSEDPQATGELLGGDSYSLGDYLVGDVTITEETSTGLYSMKFNNAPGWAANQFAGLPVQALTGGAEGRSYTILRNSADTLQFAQASPVFAADGAATGDVFRIAGIGLRGPSGDDVDYAGFNGISYSSTVPGLGLGTHPIRFVVANSPTVNGIVTTFQARYPTAVDLEGPLVVGGVPGIPSGNGAPRLRSYSASPSIGTTASTYAFSVDYLDPDGDPPGPHDGVEGYVTLFVEGPNGTRTYKRSTDPLFPGAFWPRPTNLSNPADPAWRTINAAEFAGFSFAPGTLSAGSHRYHFEASDGWSVVRVPENPENDPAVVVNTKPVLTVPEAGGVVPSQGNTGTVFRFRVIYLDGDNQAPASVTLRLTLGGTTQTLVMTQSDPTDTNYTDGAEFVYLTDAPAKKLGEGTYSYRFEASDGIEAAAPTFTQSGPVVRGDNSEPLLLEGAVTPESDAFDGNSFDYTVRYRDPDGDTPAAITVTVFDKDGTTILNTLDLVPVDPADSTYSDTDGVAYHYVGYSFTQTGEFSYQFAATDGLNAATGDVDQKSGPVVNTPPELSGASLFPESGLSSDLYSFSVFYTDADGLAPGEGGYVRLVLTKGATVSRYDMLPLSDDWAGGVQYAVDLQLEAGVYSYHFEASDGMDPAADTPETSGPSVTAAPEIREARVTPAIGRSTDTFVYTATLANPDGTGPTEMVVIIDGPSDAAGIAMGKVTPGDSNFTAGVKYQYQTTLAPGVHSWYIRARVAGETIFPAGQSAASPGVGPTVNQPPALTFASVTPTFGRPEGGNSPTLFTFQITYTDADGVGPTSAGYVRVWVSGVASPIVMTPVAGSTSWSSGVVYRAATTLPGGAHTFYFEASDGIEAIRLPSGSGAFDGPRVSSPPVLTPVALVPGNSGTTGTTFTFGVIYSDADGDAPADGSVKVLIDGQPFGMSKQSPAASEYVAGVTYIYSTKLSGGTHNYMFQASDGIDLVATGVLEGPVVDASGLTINANPNPASLGSSVTLSGQIVPVAAVNLTLTLTKPGGTARSINTATNASGSYSVTTVVDEVGEWDIRVAQSGGNSAVLSPALVVEPATLRVQGGLVDMISIPVSTVTGDPADIFGAQDAAALVIVRWDPLAGMYQYYGTSLDFPALGAGSGFWIRPTSTRTITLSGTLPDQTQPVEVSVSPGWNQIGSGFVESVNWTSTLVRSSSETLTLAQATSRGWVRDYLWGYDPVSRSYVLVRGSGGSTNMMNPYRGYWLRAFVPCTLVIQPPAQAQ